MEGPGALNIEEIELATNTVDVILCSHVLEHVDDKKAMPELFRILKSGGRLLAMVPIIAWEGVEGIRAEACC